MKVFNQIITLRFWLLGPMTGMLVGFTNTSVAVVQWVNHGQPGDFYFRGWNGVEVSYELWMLSGGVAGVPFGLLLLWWERRFRRHIRPVLSISLLLLFVTAEQWLITTIEFRNRELWHDRFWLVILSYLGMGWLLAVLCSRRNAEKLERSESERVNVEPQS